MLFRSKGEKTKLTAEQEELAAISNLKLTSEIKNEKSAESKESKEGNIEEKKDEKEEVAEEELDKERILKSGWDFKLGGLPKKKDCLIDEYVCFF